MMAVARGDLTTLKKLIEWGIDLNKYTVDEITPVMLAAKQGTPRYPQHILDNRCQMSDVRCQMSDVRCQMSDIRRQL